MALEMSADTYDWERLKARGDEYAHALLKLTVDEPIENPADYADRAVETIEDRTGTDAQILSDDKSETFLVQAPGDDEAWRTFSVTIRIEGGNYPTAEFTIDPDFEDKRVVHDGPLTHSDFDRDGVIDHISYLFETCQEAICEVSRETLLSEREAEAFLAKQRWGAKRAAELMGVSTSNFTTYESRVLDALPDAQVKLSTAEKTIDLLEGTWADRKSAE